MNRKLELTRRDFVAAGAGIAAGTLAAPAIVRAQGGSGRAIKIGLSHPLSGVFAIVGQEFVIGAEMYLATIKSQAAGRTLELIKEDETIQVNTGVAKARKLFERDNVDVLVGGTSSAVIYAVMPVATEFKKPYLVSVGGGADVTRAKNRSPYTYRMSYNIWTQAYPFGRYVAEKVSKKTYVFCPDYVAGKEFADAFKAGYQAAGGQMVGEDYAPITTADFVPYLTKIAQARPEAVYGFWGGAAGIRYLKAFDQLGLNKTIRNVLIGYTVDYDVLGQIGDAAIGTLSIHPWNQGLPFAENEKLVGEYTKKHNKLPSIYAIWGWDAMKTVALAVDKLKGEVGDGAKFAAAFGGLAYEGPRGKVLIDAATHDVVQDLYIQETVNGPKGPINQLLATIKEARDPFPG